METEEITKLVDGIYKNILDKFNPGARQLINAGKTYLKALHGAAAASKIYVDAIHKLARQAQQGTWGGSSDVGSALMQIVEVYKEIQNQQMNILKAFYVDLLVPLETNLEKDTKVVQSEQKRFLQQHKQRSESYSKAAATMKKQRKKNKGTTKTGLAMDKEVKNMQLLEEERTKLDAFCEQSLKTAMTQERRRYGFVLERQCSLAKHYLAYHSQGSAVLQRHLEEWQEVAQTREYLPDNVDSIFTHKLRQVSFWPDEEVYSSPRSPSMDEDRLSIASQLRKTKSMDASCLDMRCINDATSPLKPLSRAKSDFNLAASTHSLANDNDSHTLTRPKSIAVERSHWDSQIARALYAYLSSGDNQLSFLEGDVIALMGERNKGWQFGENLRTQCSGWFPLAYTEMIIDDAVSSPTHQRMQSYDSTGSSSTSATTPATPTNGMTSSVSMPSSAGSTMLMTSPGGSGARSGKTITTTTALIETRTSGVTMFGDTLTHRSTAKQIRHRGRGICVSVGPPPLLPAPVIPIYKVPARPRMVQPPPMPPLPCTLLGGSGGSGGSGGGTASKRAPGVGVIGGGVGGVIGGGIGNASLHSSNDSGFSNDPPPAPEVDYSDDETARHLKQQRKRNPNKKQHTADDVTKNRLLSSVRGWLLYKSAIDLWEDVNNQENISRHHSNNTNNNPASTVATLQHKPPVARQASVPHLATLNRSHDNLGAQTEFQMRNNGNTGDGISGGGTVIKRSKSLWRFKKDVDVGLVEGMSLWQHRSLVDVSADTEAEGTRKEDTMKNGYPKGTPIMKTKLVPVKCEDVDEKVSNGTLTIEKDYYDNTGDDLGYEEVNTPVLKTRKAKLIRTNRSGNDIDDDGLRHRKNTSSDSPDYESDFSANGDTDSCIVVNDHLRSATLRTNSGHNRHDENILPRTKLFSKYSMTLGSKSKNKIENRDEGGLLFYGKTLEKRLSKPERGSRFDQVSTTTGNMCGPWYDLWGVDQSVKK